MNQLPQRVSLLASVTQTLRDELRKGEWGEYLPGERPLCDRLQVSRVTLRAALQVLRREGLIEVVHGRPTRIIARPSAPTVKSNVVAMLVAQALDPMNMRISFLLNKLEHHLHLAGFEMRLLQMTRLSNRSASRRLEMLTKQTRAACWGLIASDMTVQRWFMERPVPAFIIGTQHYGIQIPAIDVHYEAVCLHAAGKLLGLGHRRVALLLPIHTAGGVVISQQGFLRAFQASRRADPVPVVLHHDGTRSGVCRTLDTAFRSPTRPTAVIVAYAWHAVTAVGHLIRSGLRVPEDVSVICRDFEPFLHAQVPSIAHYEPNNDLFARCLTRMAVELARTGTQSGKPKWIMPQFREGETVAKSSA